jgi:hypothetical protein
VLIKHLTEGTPAEQITAEVGAIQLEAQRTQSTSQFNSLATKYGTDLQKQILNEDGAEIISLQDAPELEDVRQGWVNAVKAGDISGVAAAYTDAIAIIRQAERAQAKVDKENAVKLERAAAKEKMEDAGINDLGTGNNASFPTGGDSDGLWGSTRIDAAVNDMERSGKKVLSDVRPGGGG